MTGVQRCPNCGTDTIVRLVKRTRNVRGRSRVFHDRRRLELHPDGRFTADDVKAWEGSGLPRFRPHRCKDVA